MPTKGSRCCSKCGNMKNPSGYCPTCYQNKKCSTYQPCATVGYFSETRATKTTAAICSKCGHTKNSSGYCPICYQIKKQEGPKICSKCGQTKNPSGYCPTCYQTKKQEKEPSTPGPVAKIKSSIVSFFTKITEVQCSKCGCTKNPSGYCPTCYQMKKEEEAKTTSTTVSLSTKTAQVQCSKCGHTKNPSGYCPTCYQIKKQEFTKSSLPASRQQSTPIKRAHEPAGYITPNLEDTFCIISDSETASQSSASDSGYIIWDLDDTISTLVRASPSPVAKTLPSPITLTERGPTDPDDKDATTPNKSIPTKPVTTSEKPKATSNPNTQATRMADINLVPSIPASTQPIGTAPVTMMPISEKSPEWAYISMRMLQTMPSATIQSISKVHNEWLMERYKLAKRRMLFQYNNKFEEKILFHGTSEVPPSKIINTEFGFDFRHCSKGLWGIGAYFAVNANYSNSYSYKPMGEGYREILAAWVLTGESYRCEQDKTLRRPPAKSLDSDESYDTVCGHVGGSDVYVVYDHEKAYPSYIIRYTV